MCLSMLSSYTIVTTPILCKENTMSCMFTYRKMKLASNCIGYEENAKEWKPTPSPSQEIANSEPRRREEGFYRATGCYCKRKNLRDSAPPEREREAGTGERGKEGGQ